MKGSAMWSVIGQMIGFALGLIGKQAAQDVIDSLLDSLEKAAVGKPYEPAVMAATSFIRDVLSIPDEPGEDQANPI